jgi:hypothetical protein
MTSSSESRCAVFSDMFARTRRESRSRPPASAFPVALGAACQPCRRSTYCDHLHGGSLALFEELAANSLHNRARPAATLHGARWEVLRAGKKHEESAEHAWRSAADKHAHRGAELTWVVRGPCKRVKRVTEPSEPNNV